MNEKEYLQSKEAILKQYGQPEYDMGDAVNDSAKKLKELRTLYRKSKQDLKKTAEIAKAIKELAPLSLKPTVVPEEIVRPEWLIAFNKEQLIVVRQWLMNTRQGVDAIAKATRMTSSYVKSVMQSEAFGLLVRHLRNAHKEILVLEAQIRLRECFDSENHSVKFNSTKFVLVDSGDMKNVQDEAVAPKERVLDDATQERLRKLANELRQADKDKE